MFTKMSRVRDKGGKRAGLVKPLGLSEAVSMLIVLTFL